MAGLLALFAEFERDILRARVRAGLDQLVARVVSSGGHGPRRSRPRR
jgi:DNA invertase Pin-like site-specific DNA recombinase